MQERNGFSKKGILKLVTLFYLLVSPDNSRAHWPLGRVIETYIGRDKYVHSVKVQVGDKQFVRPVVKLCPLELDYSA